MLITFYLTIDLSDCGGMKYVDEIYFKREKIPSQSVMKIILLLEM